MGLLIFFNPILTSAQQGIKCGNDVLNDLLYKIDTFYYQKLGLSSAEFDKFLNKYENPKNTENIITIPIVFHVMHDPMDNIPGLGSNLSEAQILTQIDVLNEDFQRKIGTRGYNNNSIGAKLNIQFCLARLDPNGNNISGIYRMPYANSNNHSLDNSSDANLKSMSRLDSKKYLNVYIVKRVLQGTSTILGYAYTPDQLSASQQTELDGIVIGAKYVGSIEKRNASSPFFYIDAKYKYGRTLTHEVGHYLNLLHTWGDGGCGVDDKVNDTPNCKDPYYDCIPVLQCGNQRMIENYLDYTPDECMNIFTLGQSARANASLSFYPFRSTLVSPQNIINTGCIGTSPDTMFLFRNQNNILAGKPDSIVINVTDYRGIGVYDIPVKIHWKTGPENISLPQDTTMNTNQTGNIVLKWNPLRVKGDYTIEISSAVVKNNPKIDYLLKVSVLDSDLDKYKVYPNPVNDRLSIFADLLEKQILDISIYSLEGKRVYYQSVNTLPGETIDIPFNSYSNGVYLLSITSNTGVKTMKIIH